VRALFRFAQPELRSVGDNLDLVIDVVAEDLLHVQHARHQPVDQREHVHREVVLQLGVLVQVVEHDLRDGVLGELDHQADLFLALVA
jgi:hypothetical protein